MVFSTFYSRNTQLAEDWLLMMNASGNIEVFTQASNSKC